MLTTVLAKDTKKLPPNFINHPYEFLFMIEPNYIEIIANSLNLKQFQVENTLKLLAEQNTVPFIARYRKEATGNLDENQIRLILELKEKEEKLHQAKISAITNIEKQDKLTPELKTNIENATTLKEVEDLYNPYKLKKKTKAMIAQEKGFNIIAKQIKNQNPIQIPQELLNKYTKEEIIKGAKDIVTQEIADDTTNRQAIRYYYKKYGEISSKYATKHEELPEKTQKQIYKFDIYKNFSAQVNKLKSYQTLALNRGEDLKIIKIKLENDEIALDALIEKIILKPTNKEELTHCVKEGYKKIFSSIETEIRNELTQKAQEDAITTFQQNLNKLLMTKPQYGKKVLGIDPGYRTGCKIAILDEIANPKEFSKIYLEQQNQAIATLKTLISKHSPDIIAIGNGTASNEIYELIKKKLHTPNNHSKRIRSFSILSIKRSARRVPKP